MVLGVLQVELQLPGISSLKSKRSLLKRIFSTIQNDFNVSASELGALDQWQRAHLGFAIIGSSKDVVEGSLARLLEEFRNGKQVDLIDHHMELL